MIKGILCVFTIWVVLSLVGCSNSLQREQAAEAIMHSQFLAQPLEKEIKVGDFTPACGDEPDSDSYGLKEAGFLTIQPGKEGYWHVELTQAGKDAMVRVHATNLKDFHACHLQIWTYTIATPQSVNVTGLSRADQITEAEFHVIYKPNELGEMYLFNSPIDQKLSDQKRHLSPILFQGGEDYEKHVARFKLFDDGWRLVE
jgi:hypothetical protein